MSEATEDILAPSLKEEVARPIYSVGAFIAAAFFGGSFAVVLLAAENSRRLARLRHDATWLVLLAASAIAAFLGAAAFLDVPSTAEAARSFRVANRGLGFALVGGAYLLHRKAYRASAAMGINSPSPYVAVIAAVIAGYAVAVGLMIAYQFIRVPQ